MSQQGHSFVALEMQVAEWFIVWVENLRRIWSVHIEHSYGVNGSLKLEMGFVTRREGVGTSRVRVKDCFRKPFVPRPRFHQPPFRHISTLLSYRTITHTGKPLVIACPAQLLTILRHYKPPKKPILIHNLIMMCRLDKV